MKLFYSPGACSMGIHLLLEEIGKPYETQKVSTAEGEQTRAPYIDLNPKGKVPALMRDDGLVVTEFPVIAHWLGQANGLLPADPDAALHAAETMEYCVGTVHGQGFGRVFRPANFTPNEAEQEAVRARGRELLDKGFALVSTALGDRPFIGGQSFSVADAALFYVEYWAARRVKLPLPANLAAHLDRILARPAAGRMLVAEGLLTAAGAAT